MSKPNKRVRIMAGPNGSGKSTILEEIRKSFYSGPFVNADELEKKLNQEGSIHLSKQFNFFVQDEKLNDFLKGTGKSWIEKASKENTQVNIKLENGILKVKAKASPYDAAIAADFIRHELLSNEITFTFETVLSHPSKIDFLNKSIDAGYKNYLYFICTVDPTINIERVKMRVDLGGHAVPEDKIEKRYFESLEVLCEIIPLCHRVYLFDNSLEARTIEPIAEIGDEKQLIFHKEEIPWWIEEYVVNKLYR